MSDVYLDLFDTLEVPHTALLTPDEIFDRADAALLEQLREDKRLERKPAGYRLDALAEYISMWANTAPSGGLVVVGMADGGVFQGLGNQGTDKLNRLEKAPRDLCPDAKVRSKRIEVRLPKGERDFVLLFRVEYHPSRVVKTNKGDAFARWGDSKHKLNPDEVRQLQADKNEVSFETEPCGLEYPDDFDRAAVQRFCARVREEKGWGEAHHPDADVLTLMHLGKMKKDAFVPNIACALLFAKDPRLVVPGCRIRFLRFDGDHEGTGDKWNAIKDEFVDGTVPHLITQTEKLLESQLRTFSKLGTNNKFFTQPEYPKTAWYEALVNACVHRSYGNGLKNVPIFVKMFDNRLLVESPGPFPPFVTPENIHLTHHPRNPHLMDAMLYLEFVKCAHEGTRRMIQSMKEMQLPHPEFQQAEMGHHTVRVTLKNNVHQRKAWVDRDVTELVGAILARRFGEVERRLVNFVAEHGEMSVSDAQRLLGGDWTAARRKLMKLVELGVLVRHARTDLERDPQARFRLNRDTV